MWYPNEYKTRLPQFLQEFLEIIALDETSTKLFDMLNAQIKKDIIDNKFFDTLTLEGIEKWEKILNIQNSSIDDSNESRINAIKSKIQTQPPLNMETLKDVLTTYLGFPTTVTVLEKAYTVTIKYKGIRDLPDLTPLYKKLYEIIPANMAVEFAYIYTIWKNIKLKTWGELKRYTWDFVLYNIDYLIPQFTTVNIVPSGTKVINDNMEEIVSDIIIYGDTKLSGIPSINSPATISGSSGSIVIKRVSADGESSIEYQLNSQLFGCDKVNSVGKIVRKTKVAVFDGVTSGLRFSTKQDSETNVGYTINLADSAPGPASGISNVVCSHGETKNVSDLYYGTEPGVCLGTNNAFSLFFGSDSDILTVEDANGWLVGQRQSGTPVVVVYETATETEDGDVSVSGELTLSISQDNTISVESQSPPKSVDLNYISGYEESEVE